MLRRLRIDIIALLGTTVLAGCISMALKVIIAMPRPDGTIHDGYSFPSNHATVGAAFFALLAFLVQDYPWLRARASGRALLWMLCLSGAIYIAWYRVYSGAHYPVDVIAGFILGAAIAVITAWLLRRIRA